MDDAVVDAGVSVRSLLRGASRPARFPQVLTALTAEREKKKEEFGWKANYGLTTSTEKGNEKRAEAEARADEFFYAALGRLSPKGQEFLHIRAYFEMLKVDMGWKDTYGKLTSAEEGNKKRQEANEKALKYTCDKFGKRPQLIQPFLFDSTGAL